MSLVAYNMLPHLEDLKPIVLGITIIQLQGSGSPTGRKKTKEKKKAIVQQSKQVSYIKFKEPDIKIKL